MYQIISYNKEPAAGTMAARTNNMLSENTKSDAYGRWGKAAGTMPARIFKMRREIKRSQPLRGCEVGLWEPCSLLASTSLEITAKPDAWVVILGLTG